MVLLESSQLFVDLVYTFVGAIFGIVLLIIAAAYVPTIVNRLTPNINEEREIVRGNKAVAEYFGRIMEAAIIGISIVIAASIIAGMHV